MVTIEEIRKVVREELERARGIEDPTSYGPWGEDELKRWERNYPLQDKYDHIPLIDQRKPI